MTHLPDELWLAIFYWIRDVPTLCRMQGVCEQWQDVLADEPLWRAIWKMKKKGGIGAQRASHHALHWHLDGGWWRDWSDEPRPKLTFKERAVDQVVLEEWMRVRWKVEDMQKFRKIAEEGSERHTTKYLFGFFATTTAPSNGPCAKTRKDVAAMGSKETGHRVLRDLADSTG